MRAGQVGDWACCDPEPEQLPPLPSAPLNTSCPYFGECTKEEGEAKKDSKEASFLAVAAVIIIAQTRMNIAEYLNVLWISDGRRIFAP